MPDQQTRANQTDGGSIVDDRGTPEEFVGDGLRFPESLETVQEFQAKAPLGRALCLSLLAALCLGFLLGHQLK